MSGAEGGVQELDNASTQKTSEVFTVEPALREERVEPPSLGQRWERKAEAQTESEWDGGCGTDREIGQHHSARSASRVGEIRGFCGRLKIRLKPRSVR